jgi:hypothetical protein
MASLLVLIFGAGFFSLDRAIQAMFDSQPSQNTSGVQAQLAA